jgi:hypothetical protein
MAWFDVLSWRNAKRLVVIVFGVTVLLIGLALTVLPGPAFIVIPLGLVILASEFVWARNLLLKVRARAAAYPSVCNMIDKAIGNNTNQPAQEGRSAPSGPTADSDKTGCSSPPVS